MKLRRGAELLLLTLQPFSAAAQGNQIDEIIVGGESVEHGPVQIDVSEELLVDTALALKQLPGANVNSNGAITGIAQYRGMYGDRVAVTIDQHAVVSGGPNAMDPPLSYVSPMITKALAIERGIASVSSAPESIGGYINTQLDRGEFGNEEFGTSGFLGSRYSGNGNLSTTAGRLTVANKTHRFSIISEIDNGNDIRTPTGLIRPSAVDRQRYDISYSYADGSSHIVVFAGKLDTEDSGTPALPMDIRLIETDLYGGHFLYAMSDILSVEGRISANDVDHVMDNFALREAPPPMRHRQNYATGSGTSFTLAAVFDFDNSVLQVGSHGIAADHDSTITNPNSPAFRIENFSNVQRDLISIFGEWSFDLGSADLEAGLSLKRVTTSSGTVSASGVMGDGLGMLASAFNRADRELTFDDIDAVFKYSHGFGDAIKWHFSTAQKSRAPSYQELYLWAPMQATGGLADGRTYVGDLELQPEISRELSIGLDAANARFNISPQLFYKRIDNYIQGEPSPNATANAVSMMMNGVPVLQFSNTDAEIWGFDFAWTYALTEHLTLDGVATYTRGKRTDIDDDLYRLAPLNGSIRLSYATHSWKLGARLLAYADQENVASYNNEQPTDGHERLDLTFAWTPSQSLRFEARVENLFDSTYQDHLAGINRAGGSDIPIGTRIYGSERTLGAGIILNF